MTKTTKQLIEEFPGRPTFKDVCYEDFAQVIEALKEAAEIIIKMNADFVGEGMRESQAANIWLKKNGFEEDSEYEDNPESQSYVVDKWVR